MNDEVLLTWYGYRYLPYERELARRELHALGVKVRSENKSGIVVSKKGLTTAKLSRLTYFQTALGLNGHPFIPDQSRAEQSAFFAKTKNATQATQFKKQQTRYSAHGLHEYKGKFNPQIVRAIGNIFKVDSGDAILDPFCGSGTSLVEAALQGWNAFGVDINPLAVLIANAKLSAIRLKPNQIELATSRLTSVFTKKQLNLEKISKPTAREISYAVGSDWQACLPNIDYLKGWFPTGVLGQLAGILSAIRQEIPVQQRPIYYAVLSDILRDVSWQEPEDLRIRRRDNPMQNYPVTSLFIDAIHSKSRILIEANKALRPANNQMAVYGDSSRALVDLVSKNGRRKFDFAITSPPYATALPYIDTQRLSLVLLGLLEPTDIATAEKSLVGAREISKSERNFWEGKLRGNVDRLPNRVALLCRQLLSVALEEGNGFRRQNTPSLLYRYFVRMDAMFEQVSRVLRRSGKFALVVGQNATQLSGRRYIIDTPALLSVIAEGRKFDIEENIPLETYQRYGLHNRNSIKKEHLIILRRR